MRRLGATTLIGLAGHDFESRRYEIENLPAAVVEEWGGMSLDESRSAGYVGRTYAWYGEQVLLQIVYILLFADGCRAVVLTPRARLRASGAAPQRVAEHSRPLLGTVHPYDEPRASFVFDLPQARP